MTKFKARFLASVATLITLASASPAWADATPECNVDGVAVDSTECGVGSEATGTASTAVGDDATGTGNNSTAVGQNANSVGLNSIAANSTVIGQVSAVTGATSEALAIGHNAFVNDAGEAGTVALTAVPTNVSGTAIGG